MTQPKLSSQNTNIVSVGINRTVSRETNNPKHFKMMINIPKDISVALDVETNRHVTYEYKDGRMVMKFHKEQVENSRVVNYSQGYAKLPLEQDLFGLAFSESVKAKRYNPVLLEDGFEFEFDHTKLEELEPFMIPTRKIKNKEDKLEAGFKDDSAWGEKYHKEANQAILDHFNQIMAARYNNGK